MPRLSLEEGDDPGGELDRLLLEVEKQRVLWSHLPWGGDVAIGDGQLQGAGFQKGKAKALLGEKSRGLV